MTWSARASRGRFWIYLIGLNVVAFLLVSVATQLIPNAGRTRCGRSESLLAIGAAIALGIVALIRSDPAGARNGDRDRRDRAAHLHVPDRRLAATRSCASLGPPPPPPLSGTLTLQVDPPLAFEAIRDGELPAAA